VLDNPELAEQMAENNYRLGQKYYSFEVLEQHLFHIIEYLAQSF